MKRGELHREKRSVSIAAEPEEVLEWVKALNHITDKHRQFLHENPMFREDIGVNGLADPDVRVVWECSGDCTLVVLYF